MKIDKLKKHFADFLSWDKKEIKKNESKITELMVHLKEKRKKLEKKIKVEENHEEKVTLQKKLKAVNKLIKKAKKSLY